MNIYIARHGQTDWNKKQILLGSTDLSLSDEGRKQALKLKENLKNIHFDYILSSNLKRARETAFLATNSNEIIINPNFRERFYGKLEGTKPSNISEYWDVSKNVDLNEVEPVVNFLKRIFNEIDKLKEIYNENDTILIVTHHGVAMAIDAYFNDKYNYCFDNFIFDNCSYKKYILK